MPDGKGNNKLVVLEVNETKDNVEIVHWHEVDNRGLKKIKRQAEREDGQLLILPSESSEEAGALSGPALGSPNEKLSPSSERYLTEAPIESEGPDLVPTSDNVSSDSKVNTLSSDIQEINSESSEKLSAMDARVRELAGVMHLDNVEIVTDASTLSGKRAAGHIHRGGREQGRHTQTTLRIIQKCNKRTTRATRSRSSRSPSSRGKKQ